MATATAIAGASVPTLEPDAFAKVDDVALVSAIHAGDDRAFEAFYGRHNRGVLSFARHMLGNMEDAEDAVQLTFLAAHRHLRANPPEHPRAWLYTVARNRCLTTLRDRRPVADEMVEPSTAGLAEEVERREELQQIMRDVGKLPENQRIALLLFEIGALSQAETAEAMDIPEAKVKALVFQARTTLSHRSEARDTACVEVRHQIASLSGGRLNNRTIKHHLEVCLGCTEFRDEVRRQRRRFALILPVFPLATMHGRVLGGLGLTGGSSHAAAAGASHVTGGQVAAGSMWAARPGRVGRLAQYAARPRVAALATLTVAAATAVSLATGGHPSEVAQSLTPPAHAAVPQATPAVSAHASKRKQHHTVVHRHRVVVHKHLSSPPANALPAPQAQSRKPAAGPPPSTTKPKPKSPSPHKPVRSPPAQTPSTPPSSPPSVTPPSNPPATTCAPPGNGQGHAWGRCPGPDGLPLPAEQHSQGGGKNAAKG